MRPVGALLARASLDAKYSSSYNTGSDLDPLKIQKAYTLAESRKEVPRDAWLMQCVQEDRSNPIPCTEEDKVKFGKDGTTNPYLKAEGVPLAPGATPTTTAAPEGSGKADADDLMRQMMGDDKPKNEGDKAKQEADDLMRQMMGGSPSAKPAVSAAPSAKPLDPNEELMKEMMGEKK